MTGRPILVTGSPRSGSTWIGRVISHAPSVRYVHEPFNISTRPCACGVQWSHWFCYVSGENEAQVRRHIEHHLRFNLISVRNALAEAAATRRIRPVLQCIVSPFANRALIKDPLAVFSAEWLASTFHMEPVVIIRHPAAIVSSYKALNWSHPFSHFLAQRHLMNEHLSPYEAEIRDFAKNPPDVIDQAALLWRLVHHVIRKYRDAYPAWIFVRHEDVAADPINRFKAVFSRLALDFTPHVQRHIELCSADPQQAGETNPAYSVRRDAQKAIAGWREQLTAEEIGRIRRRVEDVSSSFYADSEW